MDSPINPKHAKGEKGPSSQYKHNISLAKLKVRKKKHSIFSDF
jgi:hypothetical protein